MAAAALAGDLKTATVLGKPALSAMLGSKALPQLNWHKPSNINWTDFNYPPGLRLIHYDIQELPSALRGSVRLLNMVFVISVIACWFNFLTTLVVVPWTSTAPARWFLQTIVHLILLPSASLWTFYLGYRGLAEPDPQLVKNFQAAEIGLSLVYLMFSLLPLGCVNGIFRLGYVWDASDSTAIAVYWTVAVLLESGLWALATGLGIASILTVRRKAREDQDWKIAEKAEELA